MKSRSLAANKATNSVGAIAMDLVNNTLLHLGQ